MEVNGKTVLKPRRPIQNSVEGDQKFTPRALDNPGYQFIQTRGCIIIDTETDRGHVAVLPIGMFQVSSVNLSVKAGDHVRKGDEISWFEFGGSDIVMVFEKKANPHEWPERVHHLMGHQLCRLGPEN